MANKKDIDLTVWVSQTVLAKELGVKVQNVHNWINRKKIESIEYEFLPGQIIILVNKNTISVNDLHYKRRG